MINRGFNAAIDFHSTVFSTERLGLVVRNDGMM